MSKDKIIKKIREELPKLKKEYPIKTLGIFGSVARGDDTSTSDVDILVEFYENKTIDLFEFIDLEENLAELLGKKVDLVTKRALKPAIKHYILNDLIYV